MNHTLKSYLETRRSTPAKMLSEPGPDKATIGEMLSIAARVPDHGKLAPWRFIVYSGEARNRLGGQLADIALNKDPQISADRLEMDKERLLRAPVVIAVVSQAAAHPKIPEWEQVLSAGAVCFNLLMAANACGFAANWITEWISQDPDALAVLGVEAPERIAGMIYIGTPTIAPTERVRPQVEDITRFVDR